MSKDIEMQQFQQDLLKSASLLRAGKASRVTHVEVPAVVKVRMSLALSQSPNLLIYWGFLNALCRAGSRGRFSLLGRRVL
jgi:hypothetical protein